MSARRVVHGVHPAPRGVVQDRLTVLAASAAGLVVEALAFVAGQWCMAEFDQGLSG
ncbi:hypothetical protein [Amycolatopsis taiwanensis]|uniref:hypothetical protein n=1 Tax=Amycolatopsis taiwanensis TaxID=342230 RepID=UPI0004B3A29C|nr:hypothetical protein [Amycolatopsis taiwanensis]